ncbi:hypothetical protein [Alteribacillus sp. YIM 98480]|uniref:hypothetical protein n=1 Tax=Alteribacillus sp. YIM 98480 TaxID=2606599 RepID=UPI00131C1952|nr:hypothetical protein [Alteribacillus sp. YIM 98480]
MSDSYKDLKKLAFALEKNINDTIKKELNNENIAKAAGIAAKTHARFLRSLQEYSEILSAPLNIPTKKDVSNIAKLIIQLEDKIDNMEEELIDVKELLQNKQSPDVSLQDTSHNSKKKQDNSQQKENKGKDNSEKKRHELKKLMALNYLLTSSAFLETEPHQRKKGERNG